FQSLDKSAGAGIRTRDPDEVQSNALPTRLSGLVANYACGNMNPCNVPYLLKNLSQ
ncbi:hypothetical protein TNCV_1578951, partial [Trichonephila clavipes]